MALPTWRELRDAGKNVYKKIDDFGNSAEASLKTGAGVALKTGFNSTVGGKVYNSVNNRFGDSIRTGAKKAVRLAQNDNFQDAIQRDFGSAVKDTGQFAMTVGRVAAQPFVNTGISANNLGRAVVNTRGPQTLVQSLKTTPKIAKYEGGLNALKNQKSVLGNTNAFTSAQAEGIQTTADVASSFMTPGLGKIKMLDKAGPLAKFAGYTGVRALEGGTQTGLSSLSQDGDIEKAQSAFQTGALYGGVLNAALSPKLAGNATKEFVRHADDIQNASNMRSAAETFRDTIPQRRVMANGQPVFYNGQQLMEDIATTEVAADEKFAMRALKKGERLDGPMIYPDYIARQNAPVRFRVDEKGKILQTIADNPEFAERFTKSIAAPKPGFLDVGATGKRNNFNAFQEMPDLKKNQLYGGENAKGFGGVGSKPLDTVNPTGTVFTKYDPKSRANAPLADNIRPLSETSGKSSEEMVTVYRGTVSSQSDIQPGDFITTNRQLAQDYAGNGKVIEKKVRYGEIMDDANEPMGEEYLYRPPVSDTPKFSSLADKKVRFEIDDSNARMKGTFLNRLKDNQQGVPLKQVFNHDELYKQYPEMENITVKSFDSLGNTKGSFDPNTNTISLNSSLSRQDMRSTILHELQHSIQTKEGFAKGGSLESTIPEPIANRINTLAEQKRILESNLDSISKRWERGEIDKNSAFSETDRIQKQLKPIVREHEELLDKYATVDAAQKNYNRLAGEVEARDVQSRMDLTPAERSKSMPYASQNVPVKDQIVRFDGGKMNSQEPTQPLTIKALDPNAGQKGYGSQGNPLQEKLVDNNPDFNVNRLNVTPETKQVLSETIDVNNKLVTGAKGTPIKRTEVVKRAEWLAKDSNGRISRDEILDYQARMLSTRQSLAQAVEQSNGAMTPELAKILQEDMSQSKFLASSLSNRAIDADGATKSPLISFIKEIEGHGNDLEEVLKKAEGIDFNDGRQAAEFYRSFIKPKAGDWLDLLRYNSMLSSPNTQINNAFGSVVQVAGVKPLEKTILGGIDFLHSSFTGKERQHFVGEGGAYTGAVLKSLGEGAKAFGNVMSGKSLSTNLDTRAIPLATKGLASKVEKGLAFPMKVMEGMDQFFTTIATAGEKGALEHSARKGAKVGDISKISASNAERTVFRRELGQKGDGTLHNALDFLPEKIMEARNSDNPYISNIAKWTLPFIKTPTNILKQGIDYSPAGVLNLPSNTNKAEQLAKVAVGSAVFAGAAILAGSDRLTWGLPTNKKEKEAFLAAGRQAYSVKIGNKWVGYSKLGPTAFPIAMVAAIEDAKKNKGLDDSTAEQVIAGIAKYGEFFADQSYLKSIGDLLNSGQQGGIAKTVSNYPQQLMPYRAALGWVARLTDEVQRDPNATEGGFIDKQIAQMMSQIPGLSQKVTARTNSLGEELTNPDRFTNALSPLKVSTERADGVEAYKNTSQKVRDDKITKQTLADIKQGKNIDKPVSGTNPKASLASQKSDKNALDIAKARVESGEFTRVSVGDKVVRLNPDTGSVEVIDKRKIQIAVEKKQRAETMDTAKRENRYADWEALQIKEMESSWNDQQKLDPELDADKIYALETKRKAQGRAIYKYRQQGNSFKKPKKAKRPKSLRSYGGTSSVVKL